ncbi:MAG: histidinol-phosphate transaminase [Bacteroidales bacterium]|nr:histidinol-phosphate transaminase [Bacteroidales bacterium]
MDINQLLRKNIAALSPYSCARDEFEGEASVYLDANENPYNAPYNRYPDPLQKALKEKIAALKGLRPEQIFLGNGSDESIDLAFRAFCEPRLDNVLAIAPTYGMYKVCADINDVAYREHPLDADFQFKAEDLLARCDEHTKLIFLCSPNNPTGNSLCSSEIVKVIENFRGLVMLDEAYIDFSSQDSFCSLLDKYPNLVIFQTFSKAWASAGLRLGMAFASPEIIAVYNKVKYPYNVNLQTQQLMLAHLQEPQRIRAWVEELIEQRSFLQQALAALPIVQHIYPSDANFLLVKVDDADALYQYLVAQGIIVRNRNRVRLCEGCLRITVGTADENAALMAAMQQFINL